MYGTQTIVDEHTKAITFENDVNMYGTQTICTPICKIWGFENDVNMYGTQTRESVGCAYVGLRMM